MQGAITLYLVGIDMGGACVNRRRRPAIEQKIILCADLLQKVPGRGAVLCIKTCVVPLSTLCLWGVGRRQNWFWGE